jgi:hypothetical protein
MRLTEPQVRSQLFTFPAVSDTHTQQSFTFQELSFLHRWFAQMFLQQLFQDHIGLYT